ncbi:2-(1,2-epoxy-1,2-dihydrophenyl)acetyl-CoA isomerase [Sphingomonas vulcanisoli]|uniref:2-(1,2-epoxy-1,2-dihydrophenyl)acetyl-CoA isomerase n=1 Tax=Sphingomonas vulcanisoli TaxID=1658060 RepID=A0ABX0TW51_9SPHN|nr:enoyl-CoA hydratase-related protein [Sphingomonas vulcanisoli]NIJ08595.1 2-(1,2-epoxy-1,2-dihydrophenyl)acetyl-CoA isomerase [Sphingomonas vulcanisoli]
MSDFATLRLEQGGAVATITLTRADRLNAINLAMFADLDGALDAAIAGGARALVLTGEGRAFCSGLDLIGATPDGRVPDALGPIVDDYFNPLAMRLANLPIPILTAVNGPAAGAGCSLALAGDIVVMARSAYLQAAFVNIGLVPDTGASWLIAKGAGRAKALEMMLLGEKLQAEDALATGLVTRVVDDAALPAEAVALATRLAEGPTVAIGLIRRQVQAALTATLEETLKIERNHQDIAGRTRDFREALTAFGEKRAPQFEGR